MMIFPFPRVGWCSLDCKQDHSKLRFFTTWLAKQKGGSSWLALGWMMWRSVNVVGKPSDYIKGFFSGKCIFLRTGIQNYSAGWQAPLGDYRLKVPSWFFVPRVSKRTFQKLWVNPEEKIATKHWKNIQKHWKPMENPPGDFFQHL